MADHLRDLAVGERARIIGFERDHPAYRGKLLALGLTPGTEFTVLRLAPLGDPVEISFRGFCLSLRKGEADALKIERIGTGQEPGR